ncbi:MAG: type II toxin-antitoxin system VapC family toxin [Candidatus Binatia bacterium]
MRSIFADAGYFIALLNPKDDLHAKAKSVSDELEQARLITSEMVLAEVLAFFADKGPLLREAASNAATQLCNNPNVTVVPQTSLQFRAALDLYRARSDKEWSLIDCASVLIMQSENIAEALTHDHHFEQAGFKALLR